MISNDINIMEAKSIEEALDLWTNRKEVDTIYRFLTWEQSGEVWDGHIYFYILLDLFEYNKITLLSVKGLLIWDLT